MYNDVLRVSRNAACGRGEETKKNRNFYASNSLFAQITHVDVALWNFCIWVLSGRKSNISSFIKIGWGVSQLWGTVENRPLPLTWPMAYTTASTTVQAVMWYNGCSHFLAKQLGVSKKSDSKIWR